MRVVNLILHILSVIVMLPDLVFIGINTLMGLGYLEGIEFLYVAAAVLLFGSAFLVSTIGSPINIAKYRSKGHKLYVKRELISHGLCFLSFVAAILYEIAIYLHSSAHGDGFGMKVNLTGFCLALAGIIFTLVCGKITGKRAKAIAKAPANTQVAASVPGTSRPKFCPECGKATGTAGEFCGSCGSKLVR